jgi:predicted metal-binding protein
MTDFILTQSAAAVGVPIHEWAILPVGALTFSPTLIEACKTNVCGNFNKSWTCPPACGTMEEQREKILSWEKIFVFTTVHKLEDSFDYEGITKGRELHTKLTIEVKKRLGDTPVYGAERCPSCRDEANNSTCAYPDPCPYPNKMIGSIEAAGIDVSKLSKAAGITYNNGLNTVTFFTMALH